MSSKTKHSKIRNTGILFELLTRQITVDVLNNDKKGSAAKILKEFFNKNTQLGKEYELYRVLTVENYKSETKANHLVDAVIKARIKLNESSLKREKYNLIKEVRSNYDISDFFMARIPNYKVNASIFKLFSTKETLKPQAETESRFTIIENITRKNISIKKKENIVVEGYKKQEKDLRLLAYSILVEKFNKKYSNLSANQRNLLKEYINNISNTNSLKEFIETETIKVKKQLQSHLPKVTDKVTKIKLKEAINQAETLMKGRIVEDKQVVTLMRYYQLVKELKNV
jgi:hypothetical protein|tara:strand:- start:777 stop:1631 length:855 start_codon:yes stop_codon:yes gene_type:complete